MIEEIKKILIGIDQTELENPEGWWETSAGAEFGANKLKQIAEALAQPEQEPVAWMTISPFGDEDDIWYANPEGQLREGWTYKALYEEPPKQNPLTSIDYVPCCTDQTCPKCKAATPPQRKPLTDEEIENLYFDKFSMGELKAFARAIEAAHGIKGEA